MSDAGKQGSQVVLITGASSGFGLAIGTALAADGHRVFGGSRHALVEPPPNFTALTLDVTQDASIANTIQTILAHAGSVDVVINNAGVGIAGAIEDTSVAEAQQQFDTNFFGIHRVCRAVLPQMRAQGRGTLINMSSLGGLVPLPFQAFYSASKFAVEAYTEALRMELRPHGIHVSMIEPGDFRTGFTAHRRLTAENTRDSVYYERCSRAVGRMIADEQKVDDVSPIVNAVKHIISQRRPALRYPRAAASQRLLVALKPFLPQPVFEYLVADNYGVR